MSLSPWTDLVKRATYRRSRLHVFPLALALLLGLCLSLSGFATAWAAGQQQARPASTTLVDNGGPIQSSPEVLLDFWGPNWANAQAQNQINYIVGLFSNLSGGDYLNILRQYGVHNQVTLVPVQGAAYYYDSTSPSSIGTFVSTPPDEEAIHETQRALQAAGRSTTAYDPNLQIMIFADTNASYGPNAQGCGWHNFDTVDSAKTVYSIIPYPNQNNCKLQNSFSGDLETSLIAAIATHEFAEAVTDPEPGSHPAWTSSAGEVGDICTGPSGGENMTYLPPNQPGISYVTQELYSNAAGQCVTNVGTAYASPDLSPPYVGQHTVQGSILARYNAGGGSNYHTVLGNPLTEEVPIAGGAVTYFDAQPCDGGYPIPSSVSSVYGGSGLTSGSAIYFSHATSAHAVRGCIYRYYQVSLGGPTNPDGLGYPLTDELPVTGGGGSGRVNYFNNQLCGLASNHLYGSGSAIYYSGGSRFVRGCIYDRYQRACGDGTTETCVDMLGLPATSEILLSGGAVSYFLANTDTLCNGGISVLTGVTAGSAIYYSSAGAYEVQGCIFQHYASIGGPLSSDLGYPTSDEHTVPGGWVSDFQGTACGSTSWGHIFSNGAAGGGTYEVDGCIDTAYIHTYGGTSGSFGWPTTDKQAIGSGYVSNFQGEVCNQGGGGHAQIYYSPATQTHMVQGCIDSKYLACGGASGPLGFPISDEKAMAGNPSPGRESDFQNGYIFWENGQAIVVPVGVTVNC